VRVSFGRLLRLAAPLAFTLLVACGPATTRRVPADYPGTLERPAELHAPGLGEAFALEQRVRSTSSQGEYEFRAVLQKQGDTLIVVGLGPHGGRGFVLTQRGDDIEFESYLPRELPFPPRYMLLDIHRAFFKGLEGPLPDGVHREQRGEEEITERWEGGLLRERTFQRTSGEPEGTIRVTYEPGLGGDEPPREVTLHNGWFGYTLTITTLSHQLIEPTSGSERPDLDARSVRTYRRTRCDG